MPGLGVAIGDLLDGQDVVGVGGCRDWTRRVEACRMGDLIHASSAARALLTAVRYPHRRGMTHTQKQPSRGREGLASIAEARGTSPLGKRGEMLYMSRAG